MTLVEMLEKNARQWPQKTAIVFRGEKTTWGGLNRTVNRLASGLMSKGLREGDRVGLMLPKCPELVVGFLAAAKARAVAAPINFELTAESISEIFSTIRPRFVIAHASLCEHARSSVPPGVDITVVSVGGGGGELDWEDALAAGGKDNPGLAVRDSDIVYFNYTSGTTGGSKGALTTHSNIYWNTLASIEALGLTPDDVHVCMFAPFAHPHELFARPLYLGGKMVLLDTVYPKTLASAIETHGVTCVMGLAPMYENLLDLLDQKPYDLSSLRIPESGGMYTRSDLIERFRKAVGAPIVPVWGSTETSGIAIANRPGSPMPQGSIGKECLSYSVRLVGEDGQPVADGEVGELAFRGPAVVAGYYACSSEAFRDGWYHSGDLARKDHEGHYYFVERKSGMMKVAGLKVYPAEIESVLMEHPLVKEASVIAASDHLRGEVPKAIVTLRPGASLGSRDLIRFCRQRLAHYKLPRLVEFRDALPKTSSGKINKKALQLEYA